MSERFDLMRRHRLPDATWIMHGSFHNKENARRFMKEMEANKPFQDYKIEEGRDEAPFWLD